MQANGSSTVPSIPVCNECIARATFGLVLGNNYKFMSPRGAIVKPVAADGIGINQAGGVSHYFSWWAEGTVAHLTIIPMKDLKPNDRTIMLVKKNGNSVIFSVTDLTGTAKQQKKKSFTITRPCGGCTFTTAEWVVGALPNISGGGNYNLPDFGTWTVSQASAKTATISGTISSFPNVALTMVNQANPPKALVAPGPLNMPGNSFTDTWG